MITLYTMVVNVARMVNVYAIMLVEINPNKHTAFSLILNQSIECFIGTGFYIGYTNSVPINYYEDTNSMWQVD